MFDPDPDDAYRSLTPRVRRWVDDLLDDLEDDPGAAHLHKKRFQKSSESGAYRRIGDEDWWLLWYLDGDIVVVVYLGLAPGSS